MAIRPGLCSVTFRALGPDRIAALAADAGLEVIEWGGDAHIPPGDLDRAAYVARITKDAGLVSCSYGSYFRAGAQEVLTPILDSAMVLGVDRVRVWAGSKGSHEATEEYRAETTARIKDAAHEAEDRGLSLALEFHSGTLADTSASTLRLLDEVRSPALSTYWQPTVAASVDTAISEYADISAHTSAAHVFSWWPSQQRLPLQARDSLWKRFFAEAVAGPRPPKDALLEFVPDDDPGLLHGEAAALLSYLSS